MTESVVLAPTYEFAIHDPAYNDGDTYIEGVRKGIYGLVQERILVVHPGNFTEILELIITGKLSVSKIIFPGGGDWGTDTARDEVDFALYKLSWILGIAVLGICRGFQGFGTVLRGELIPDLEDDDDASHVRRPEPAYEGLQTDFHDVIVPGNCELYQWLRIKRSEFAFNDFVRYQKLGGEIIIYLKVNTMHHQAIDWKTLSPQVKQNIRIFGEIKIPEILSVNAGALPETAFRQTIYDAQLSQIGKNRNQVSSWNGSQDHIEAYPDRHPLRIFLLDRFRNNTVPQDTLDLVA